MRYLKQGMALLYKPCHTFHMPAIVYKMKYASMQMQFVSDYKLEDST